MVLFNKANSCISDELFYFNQDTRYESEICFLIKDSKIDAVGFGLDLTKANLQSYLKEKGLPWERAKAFNNSAVLSEFIPFDGDIKKLQLKLFINSELKQEANYELMMYKPMEIVKEIESFMTLEDYDIIMSGTPKGVGTYKIGDSFVAKLYCNNELLLKQEWIVKANN